MSTRATLALSTDETIHLYDDVGPPGLVYLEIESDDIEFSRGVVVVPVSLGAWDEVVGRYLLARERTRTWQAQARAVLEPHRETLAALDHPVATARTLEELAEYVGEEPAGMLAALDDEP